MKKAFILTSIFALAACSGGSGGSFHGGHSQQVNIGEGRPAVLVQTFASESGETVNTNNQNITGMASSAITFDGVTEDQVRDSITEYVETYLGGGTRGFSNPETRAASNRTSRAVDPVFAAADAKIAQMKQVIYDMARAKSTSDDALRQYIRTYRNAVAEALTLYTQSAVSTSNDLFGIFYGLDIDRDNVRETLDAFEREHFGFTKEYMDQIRLQDAGDANAYFKFNIDEGGTIQQIALFEGANPNDYGWFTKTTNENGNEFAKKLYSYKFALGQLPTSGDFSSEQLAAFEWFNGITGKDDIVNLILRNDNDNEHLTNGAKKAAMIQALNDEFDDLLAGQHDHDNDDNIECARAQYIEMINAAFSGLSDDATDSVVFGQNVMELSLTATIHGIGKDLGLKYSDFGYVDLKDLHQQADGTIKETHTYAPYGGGYGTRNVEPGTTNATYTGTAVAGVQWSTKDVNGNKDGDGMLVTNENATLAFDASTGTSTLTMNNLQNGAGEKWYNVTVSGDFSGEHASDLTFTFSGANEFTDPDSGEIDENYSFVSAPEEIAFESEEWQVSDQVFKQTNAEDSTIDYRGSASVDYYGADGTPTETGALFHFSEEQHYVPSGETNEQHREVGIYGAFGGTRD
ncbi:MAG: hypothetical protein J6T57_04580 [Alphaproteobacteria bacterium]|nr:hypothetical protein [Alphaproteobacteria bacterium]